MPIANMTVRAGWAQPRVGAAWHFFGVDRRSLCGRWAWFGEVEADEGSGGIADCKRCRKKMTPRPSGSDAAKGGG